MRSPVLVGAALLAAMIVALLWNSDAKLRNFLNFGGWLNWHTIWYPILPLGTAAWIKATFDVVRLGVQLVTRR